MKIAVTYDEQTGEVFQHFGHPMRLRFMNLTRAD